MSGWQENEQARTDGTVKLLRSAEERARHQVRCCPG